jgi:hypothetical protein
MAEEKRNRPKPDESWLRPSERQPPAWLSDRAKTAFRDQRLLERKVKDVLNTDDVNVIEVFGYYNFGRQVLKLTVKSGATVPGNEELAALIRRWTHDGLKERILVRIVKEVFHIDYPTSAETSKKA